MSTVPGLNAEVSLLISEAKTQSQEALRRWQQPCCHPDPDFDKIPAQLRAARSGMSCHCAKICLQMQTLAFEVIQARFWEALLWSPGETRGWRHLCSVLGLVVLLRAPATDSCAIPLAAKIHCWNYTFLSGHVCIWQGFVDTTSLTAVHIFTRFTSSTLFPS